MAALWLIVVVAVLGAIAAYLTSLRLHPWRSCRSCKGGGKSRDTVWKTAFGTCKACGGRGRHPRLGVRILQPARARDMGTPKGAHRRIDKRSQLWHAAPGKDRAPGRAPAVAAPSS